MRLPALRTSLALGLMLLALHLPARAGVQFHFPVGLSFASGAYDLLDSVEDMYQAELGIGLDNKFVWPVSLAFNPYMEFDFGLGIGAAVGPASFVIIEERYYGWGYYSEDTTVNWTVPLGLDLRYTFLRDQSVSPYVRAGFRYPLTGGDYFENGQIGPVGAIGVELWRNQAVALGVEAAYDASEIDVVGRAFYKDTVRPGQFLFTVSAVF